MSYDTAATGEVQRHHVTFGPREYVIIGAILTVVTVIELAVSYAGMPGFLTVALLLMLSAFKFGSVVAFFMHLRFDNQLLTRLFVFGLALATALLVALIALFGADNGGGEAAAAEAASHIPTVERLA